MKWLLVSAVFIQPPHYVPVSKAEIREQLCIVQSHARTTQEATAHYLSCNLRYRQ